MKLYKHYKQIKKNKSIFLATVLIVISSDYEYSLFFGLKTIRWSSRSPPLQTV